MMSLARLYEQGKGGGNEEFAATWYLRAAQEGSAFAKYRIGMMFLEGKGQFKQDKRQAVDMLTKSAEEDGYAPAMVALARLREAENNLRDARLWYERASIAKEPSLSAMLELGRLAEAAGNPIEALKWYLIAHEYSQTAGTDDQRSLAVKKRVTLMSTLPEDVIAKARNAVQTWKREKEADARREERRALNRGGSKKAPAFEYE
jgi:TPR repeat protein